MTHAETRRVGVRRPLEIVSSDEVRRIHETSLDILSEVGCVYYSRHALDVLAEAGAQVDYETTVAKLPPSSSSARSQPCRTASRSAAAPASTTCRSMAGTPTSPPTVAPPSCASTTARCALRPRPT